MEASSHASVGAFACSVPRLVRPGDPAADWRRFNNTRVHKVLCITLSGLCEVQVRIESALSSRGAFRGLTSPCMKQIRARVQVLVIPLSVARFKRLFSLEQLGG